MLCAQSQGYLHARQPPHTKEGAPCSNPFLRYEKKARKCLECLCSQKEPRMIDTGSTIEPDLSHIIADRKARDLLNILRTGGQCRILR